MCCDRTGSVCDARSVLNRADTQFRSVSNSFGQAPLAWTYKNKHELWALRRHLYILSIHTAHELWSVCTLTLTPWSWPRVEPWWDLHCSVKPTDSSTLLAIRMKINVSVDVAQLLNNNLITWLCMKVYKLHAFICGHMKGFVFPAAEHQPETTAESRHVPNGTPDNLTPNIQNLMCSSKVNWDVS